MSNARQFNMIDTIDQVLTAAKDAGIIHLSTTNKSFDGNQIQLNGQDVVNFGSCSYLGLELHPAIKKGIIDAVNCYGSQYSSSRAYVSSGQYDELETLLSQLFGGNALVTATTSLGHISTLPVIIEKNDAVILDQQVHASVQTAVQLLKPKGITIELIKHNNLVALRNKIESLKATHNRIWYLADGVYSMYGDYAPLLELEQMLEQYDQLHLYVDDAHGMSWTGEHGKGYTLSQIKLHDKMILATSLNKAFASAGGVTVFPNKEWARRVRTCGGSLIFSGPIQPPMLGAAIASAKLHFSDELIKRQEQLASNISTINTLIKEKGLPIIEQNNAPIFFVAAGLPKVSHNIITRMMKDGFYLNAAAYPATPMRKGGIRFATTTHQSTKDLKQMLDALSYHYPLALKEEGSSVEDVYKDFKLTDRNKPLEKNIITGFRANQKNIGLKVQYASSIRDISPKLWDSCFSNQGNFDWQGLQCLEEIFSNNAEKENNWSFHYFIVKDTSDNIVLATFLTEALTKDDIFADASVSKQIEQQRKEKQNPYYLTSPHLMMGSLATEGNHLYLQRDHGQWRQAVLLLLNKMREIQQNSASTAMLLRDFIKDSDTELKNLLLSEGYVEMAMLDNHEVCDMDWENVEGYLSRLKKKSRWQVKQYILNRSDEFIVSYDKNISSLVKNHYYKLYKNVQEKSLELNSFPLPKKLFEHALKHPNWSFISLYIKEHMITNPDALPVAFMMCYKNVQTYIPAIAGLDYNFIKSHNCYKQIMYQTIQKAHADNYTTIKFGFGASLIKRKIGAKVVPTNAYVQLCDHFNQEAIANIAINGNIRT